VGVWGGGCGLGDPPKIPGTRSGNRRKLGKETLSDGNQTAKKRVNGRETEKILRKGAMGATLGGKTERDFRTKKRHSPSLGGSHETISLEKVGHKINSEGEKKESPKRIDRKVRIQSFCFVFYIGKK